MATVLDIGLLNYFYIIFPFLLIYASTLGLLMWLNIFGDNKVIYNIMAIVMAFIFVLSETLVQIINMMVPWIMLLLMLLMFLLIAYKFLGASDKDIAKILTRDKTITVWILILFSVIMIGSISKVYFSDVEKEFSGEGGITVSEEEIGRTGVSAFWSTLFNPQVVGVIMVLLIAVFAIMLLTGSPPLKT